MEEAGKRDSWAVRLDLEPYAFLWLLCAVLSTTGGRVDVDAELGERRGRDSNPRSA